MITTEKIHSFFLELMGSITLFILSIVSYVASFFLAMLIYVYLRHSFPPLQEKDRAAIILLIWLVCIFLPVFLGVYCILLPKSIRALYAKVKSSPPYIEMDNKEIMSPWLVFSYSKMSKAFSEISLADHPELTSEINRTLKKWDSCVALFTMPLHLLHLTPEIRIIWFAALIMFAKYLPVVEQWAFGSS